MKKIQILRLFFQLFFIFIIIIGFYNSLVSYLSIFLLCFTVIAGPLYCGWLCPFGFLQEIFNKTGNLLGIKKIRITQKIHNKIITLRYIILAMVAVISADVVFSIMSYDPRAGFETILSGHNIKVLSIVIIVVVVLLSLFLERPFCNYFCLQGAKYSLFSMIRALVIRRNPSRCVLCSKCSKVCPMNIEIPKLDTVKTPQCISCLKCVSVCPINDAIKWENRWSWEQGKLAYKIFYMVPLILAAGLFIYNIYNLSVEKKDKAIGNGTSEQKNVIAYSNQKDDLNKIKNDKDLADGIYIGEGEGFRGTIKIEVEIKNGEITSIDVISNNDDAKWFNRAYDIIASNVLETQDTEIDIVSGATYSSKGIKDAVNDALDKAKKVRK